MKTKPLKFIKMRIKKDVEPVGTIQLVKSQMPGGHTLWAKYAVIGVSGNNNYAPSVEGPTIHMELVEKQPGYLQMYVSLPLFLFDKRVMSNTPEDQFWLLEKGDNLEVVREDEA